jgi:hypothetical protein
MALERIDSLFDLNAIQDEYSKYKDVVQASYDKLLELFNLTKQFSTASIGTVGDQTAALTDKIRSATSASNDLAAAKAKLAQLYTEEAKQVAAVRLQIQQQTAENKKAAQEALGIVDAYGKLTKAYNDAQRAYKNYALTLGEGNATTKNALAVANQYGSRLKELDGNVGQFGKNVGNYSSAFSGLGDKVNEFSGQLAELAIGGTVVEKAFEFLKGSVDEFNKSEQAATRLKNILNNVGHADLFKGLSDSAEDLSKQLGTIKPDEIEQVFGKLAVFGGLTKKQITDLTPVIIDFARNSGQSIEEATDTITRALNGQGRGLKQFGIDIKTGGSEAQNFATIMDQLAPKVKGSEEAFGDTLEGQAKKVDVAIDELKLKIGTEFAPSLKQGEEALLAFVVNIPEIANEFSDLAGKVHETVLAFIDIASFGKIDFLTGFEKAKSDQETLTNTLQEQNQLKASAIEIAKKGSDAVHEEIFNQVEAVNLLKKEVQARKDNGDIFGVSIIEQQHAIDNGETFIELLREQAKNLDNNNTKIGQGPGLTAEQLAAQKKLNEELEKTIELQDKLNIERDKDAANSKTSPQAERLQSAAEAYTLESAARKAQFEAALKDAGNDAQARYNLELQYNIDVYGIDKAYTKLRVDIIEDATKQEADFIKDQTQYYIDQAKLRADADKQIAADRLQVSKDSLTEDTDFQLLANQRNYEKGLIDAEKFEKQKAEILKQGSLQSISDQIAEQQKLLSATPEVNPDGSLNAAHQGAATNIANLKVQAGDITTGGTEADQKKKADLKKKETDQAKKDADALIDLSQTLVDSGYQKELDALQKLQDANEKLKATEIDRINSSTLSEQDKAAKITVLNAQAQAQQNAIDLQKRKVQHDQAVADKAYNVAKATEEGIVATLAVIETPVLAALVAAASAVAVAKIIATPVPAYEEGTDFHPGGAALLHHGELVTEPGKNPFLTSGVGLYNLKAGTTVMTKQEVDNLMRESVNQMHVDQHGVLRSMSNNNSGDVKTERAIVWMTQQLKKELRNQKKNTVIKNDINMDRINYLQQKVYR